MTADQVRRSRRARALLGDPTFGPFFAGKVLSSCGIWIQNVAAAVLMYELTRSPLMVGLVSMAQFLAPLTLALWAGALTDRLDRRKLLMSGRFISGAAVGALALALCVRGVEAFGGPPILLASVLVMGVGLAISSPANLALVPGLVPAADLEQALALSSGVGGISRAIGPALGATLLALGGPGLAFGVAAATHWVYAGVLLLIRARHQEQSKNRPGLFGGLRYLIADRNAGMMMLGAAALGLGADPIVTLTPSLADNLQAGSGLVGVFASSFGAGAVIVTIIIRPLRRLVSLRLVGMGGFWVLGGGLVVVAAATNPIVAAAGFLVAGTGFMMAVVALSTRIQRRVPDHLRGRVMALWSVAFLGSRPVAALIDGSVASLVSVRAALLTAALIVLCASLLARVSYRTS